MSGCSNLFVLGSVIYLYSISENIIQMDKSIVFICPTATATARPVI